MNTVSHSFFTTAARSEASAFIHLVTDTARRYNCEPGVVSYGEAAKNVSDLMQAYAGYLDLAAADQIRVALSLGNRPAFFYHWLALNALGVSVVPLNPHWQSAELEYVLDHSDAVLLVVLEEELNAFRQAVGDRCRTVAASEVEAAGVDHALEWQPAADRLAGDARTECALLYTSGTTGRPKGCMLSNEYFISTGEWYRDLGGYCALEPGQDRLISPLPMYHMNAMAVSTMAMILTGSCIVPLDRFHPSTWWQSVAESNATIMHYLGVMPAMLMNLPPAATDAHHAIRFGFGAGLSGELHTAFETRFNMQLIEAWAMTETGCTVSIIANQPPRKVGTACFGRPPEYIDYRVVDDQDEDVAPGHPGELLVRRQGEQPRYGFFSGYLKDEAATREAWDGGYFRTGDLVYVDDDGLMHFVDRKKNVIRRSGENISAVEVEEVLMEHPDVQAVGVCAVPDELRGDEVCACVVTSVAGDALAEELVEHCLQRLAYYKAPGYVVFVDALPLTATEKIQRAELKALAAERVGPGRCVDTRGLKRSG